jgi:endo-1,4-beta-mannosidase
MAQPFILGVNYWPRMKAMYWWSDFDAGEVHEEFSLIRELGMSVVRIFLLWEDFQPTPGEISRVALDHLITVCDIASSNKLKLDVTFFTGHMSGTNWAPGWMLQGEKPLNVRQAVSGGTIVDQGYRNPFMDNQVLDAERLQLRQVVQSLKDHPAIWCWNLGNEPDNFAFPGSESVGNQWSLDMVSVIKDIDPIHPVTCGLHVSSLLYNNGLRLDQIFSHMDFSVMHSYPMYLTELTGDPLDIDYVPFTCALTAALSEKPVLMEEFGGCTAPPGKSSFEWEWNSSGIANKQFMASEDDMAEYYAAVLPKLLEVGALGAFIWCFADYHERLWDSPPCSNAWHERYFGLVRPDGSLKSHANVVREFAARHPVVLPAKRKIDLPYPRYEYYQNTLEKFMDLYKEWKGQS